MDLQGLLSWLSPTKGHIPATTSYFTEHLAFEKLSRLQIGLHSLAFIMGCSCAFVFGMLGKVSISLLICWVNISARRGGATSTPSRSPSYNEIRSPHDSCSHNTYNLFILLSVPTYSCHTIPNGSS